MGRLDLTEGIGNGVDAIVMVGELVAFGGIRAVSEQLNCMDSTD